jgi:hypothetical protein
MAAAARNQWLPRFMGHLLHMLSCNNHSNNHNNNRSFNSTLNPHIENENVRQP